ncbi:hypothetical protein CLV63_101193 [Murinocardiopsis flavida]|uniref:DUF3558 family protein n=1 Tax=Murinocardiopsis flavida TaxID=645275 RepID=A0A2P8DU27_9ACTN|nr:hypothetical protein [Murinocardiopsis flavida]PSL00719.1 hypothetical protein CLV63_101193 [Murinocardiopsis flavida]
MAQPPNGWHQHGRPEARPPGPHSGPPDPAQAPAGPGAPAAAQPPPLIAAAPRGNRGCAVTAVVTAAVLLLLLVVGGVAGVVWLNATGGDFEATPDCAVGETTALGALVPDYRTEIAEPIDTKDEGAWWDGEQCTWTTPEKGSSVPASATLVMARHENRPGAGAEEEAAKDLREQSGEYHPERIAKLGDEALSWFDDDVEQGCAGVRLSNLFVFTCYTAGTDFEAMELISDDEAVAGAEELLRATVKRINAQND